MKYKYQFGLMFGFLHEIVADFLDLAEGIPSKKPILAAKNLSSFKITTPDLRVSAMVADVMRVTMLDREIPLGHSDPVLAKVWYSFSFWPCTILIASPMIIFWERNLTYASGAPTFSLKPFEGPPLLVAHE